MATAQRNIKSTQGHDDLMHLIEHMPVNIILQNAKAEVIAFNKRALHFLGFTQSTINRTSKALKVPDIIKEDGSRFEKHLQPNHLAIATKKPVSNIVMGIYRHQLKSREWYIVSADPILDEHKKVKYVICSFVDITEQKKTVERAQLLSQIVEETQNGVILSNQAGIITWHNVAFTHITRLQAKSILDFPVTHILGEAFHQAILLKSNSLDKRTGPINELICFEKIKGQKIWLRVQHQKMEQANATAEPIFFTIIRDVTENHLASLELTKRENAFATFCRNIQQLVATEDYKKDVEHAAIEIGKTLQLSRVYIFETAKKDKPTNYFEWRQTAIKARIETTKANEKIIEKISAQFANNTTVEPIIISIKKPGTSVFKNMLIGDKTICTLLLPIYQNEELWGFVAFDDCLQERDWQKWELDIASIFVNTIVNVIERGRNKQRMEDANERYISVINATRDAIWDYNLKKNKVYWNDKLLTVFGYDKEHVNVGKGFWESKLHPEDKARVIKNLQSIAKKKKNHWTDQYRFKCADGRYKHVYDNGYIFFDEQGKLSRMIGAMEDITKRKELETQIVQQKITEQNAVANAYINAQDKERLEIGKELHDNINQILSTTQLYLDVALGNKERREELIKRSLENVHYAISEIRNLSRTLVPPSLGDIGLKESIVDLVENMNAAKKIKFSLRWSYLKEDQMSEPMKLMLYRIVQQQCNNIMKHAQAKNAQILLTFKKKNLFLEISDDGIGFDAKKLKIGIGLTNIQNRVQLFNGDVKINASKLKGCTLQISIPM
jgi:PAS domain S-box-containing protein